MAAEDQAILGSGAIDGGDLLASLRNDNFSLTLNSAFTNGEPALLAAPLDQATMAMNKLSVQGDEYGAPVPLVRSNSLQQGAEMGLPQVPMPAAARGMPAPPAGAYYPEGAVPPGQQQQQQAPQPQQPAQPGPGGVVPAAGYQQQQPPYVPQQQPVYLDQNGQPIYYRVAPNQYDPYAGGAVAGDPNAIPADQMQAAAFQQGYPAAGRPGPPHYYDPNMYAPQDRSYGPPPSMYGRGGRGYDDRDMGRDMDMRYNDRRDHRGGRHDYRDDYGRDDYRDRRDYRDRDYDRGRGGRDRDRYGYGYNSAGFNPGRDPLVDEFRSTFGKSRPWGLRDVQGHVVAFCQDQHGSRFIQQRLEVCNDAEKQLVFEEILPVANPLMIDVFGNYVLQKLFEYGTPEQCEALALLVTGQAVDLSMQMYGCRVVQKAMEYANTQRLLTLVSEFESTPVLLRCVHDSNGNHVIQKIIEIVSRVAREETDKEAAAFVSSRIQFIMDNFKGRVRELSSHPYGCRVIQRILEHCSNVHKAAILEELRQSCAELVQDCYGNYVIQYVMQHGWEEDRSILIKEVQAHLLDFSQHKFASNVVEKCLQYASRRDRDEMVWSIINYTFDASNPVDNKGHCVLESMVRDPYANYVVQKVIDVSDERQRAAILRYVRENIQQLRRYTYGKHIIVRLEKLTNEKF